MCGVLLARGRMAGRLTLGYREAVAATPTPWMDAGTRIRGHEFHYSAVDADNADAAWSLTARGTTRDEGVVAGSVQASYLHVHWAAHPEVPRRFAHAAAARPTAA
jgi:cobyrinic acid a,c-diamide synthase